MRQLKRRVRVWKRWWKSALMVSLLAPPRPSPAMSYVPMADEALADDADVIVVGEVDQAAPAQGEELDATYYQVKVDTVLKGQVDQRWLAIRQPGAIDPNQPGALEVPGAAKLQRGERALLFLRNRSDARFEVSQMSLGAFHVRKTTTGEEVLTRDLEGAETLGATAKSAQAEEPESLRRLDRFARWIHARAAGLDIPTDYWSNAKVQDVVAAKYALYGSQPPRWFEFDRGASVTLFAGNRGQAGMTGGGYAQVQSAITAWNANPGSNVRYAYGGLTGANGGLNRADGVNTVLFNDPNNDIAGSYDCNGGGLVAVSGWRSLGLQQMNGRTFKVIVEVDTVVQDGAGCALSRSGNSTGAEVLAHELGHTLGLAHPCGDAGVISCALDTLLNDSLMRPFVHGDGRGASLRSDDIAGVKFLYPNSVASTPPPTSSPPPSSGGNTGSGSTGSGSGGGALSLNAGAMLLAAALFSARRRVLRRRPVEARADGRRRGTGTSPARRTA